VPLYAGAGLVAALLVLFILYWLVQIIINGYGKPKAVDLSKKKNINDPDILEDWNILFASMAVKDVPLDEMKKLEKKGGSTLVMWFMWVVLITICPMILMLPYIFGFVEWSIIKYGVGCYIGLLFVMMVASAILAGRSAQIGNELYFVPLGLTLTELPQVSVAAGSPRVRGGTAAEGVRFGRLVRIRMDAGGVTVEVTSPHAAFSIKSAGNELQTENGTSHAVLEVLRNVRPSTRWKGAHVTGNGQVVTAHRPMDGLNSWVFDLWLIERILEKM
jgi:hypothetical protein